MIKLEQNKQLLYLKLPLDSMNSSLGCALDIQRFIFRRTTATNSLNILNHNQVYFSIKFTLFNGILFSPQSLFKHFSGW